MIECMRRLLLSAIPALILPGTLAQVVIVLLFSLCFNGLYAEFKPFTLQSDSVVAIATEWGVTLTLLLAILLQVAELEDSFGNRGRVGVAMVLVNVGVMVFTIYKFSYNSDDKHSSALDSFKKNRQLKRKSNAMERSRKRASSTVVDVFHRFRSNMSRFSVTGRKDSKSDGDSTPSYSGTTESPLTTSAVELTQISTPPAKTVPTALNTPGGVSSKLTSSNVRDRIRLAMTNRVKDSDDDGDSDDDSDCEGDGAAPGSRSVAGKRKSLYKSKGEGKSSTGGSKGVIAVTETWTDDKI